MRHLSVIVDQAAGGAEERATRRLAYLAVRSVIRRPEQDGMGEHSSPEHVATKKEGCS
jgi:hypothetical protein